MELVFVAANQGIGTEGGVVDSTDSEATDILGIVPVLSTDWVDMLAFRMATLGMGNAALPLAITPVAGSDDIYVALIARGTPTVTNSGMTARFWFADAV